MKLEAKENKLKNLMTYITDFIKQVVENGIKFEQSHCFMLLLNLEPSEVCEDAVVGAIKIIVQELGVTEFEYV